MIRFISICALLVALCGCSQLGFTPQSTATSDTRSTPFAIRDPADGCEPDETEHLHYELPTEVDLWDRIRDGFAIEQAPNKRTQAEINWYGRHPSYMTRVSQRAMPYMYHIVNELESRGMPTEFALLPIVESAFDPFAYSHGRASGMWQVIPGTGKMLGLKQNWWYDGRRDVVDSTDAALNYLTSLSKRFDGDWLLALAAYNSGAGTVNKAIRKNKKQGKPTDYWSLDLPKETEAYVPRLLALRAIVQNPDDFKVSLESIPNTPYFAVVEIGSQLDLAQAASMADVSMEDFYLLNPGFNRWATDPDGPHRLLVPISQTPLFQEALIALPADRRVTWERYTIKNGDTLSTIAKRHRTTVDLLQDINQINGTNIRAGKTLLIPRAAESSDHYVLSMAERITAKQSKGSGQKLEYVVKSGDSLWSIGNSLNVSSKEIARWNGFAPKDTIRPGQTLVIWLKQDKNNAPLKPTTRKVAYQVRKGDSLARIASKFDIRVKDIVSWNQVNPKKYLQPGDRLTLFIDVTNIN